MQGPRLADMAPATPIHGPAYNWACVITVVWSGKHHLVCPCPTLAGVLPAGDWVRAYQLISSMFSAAFDVAFDEL